MDETERPKLRLIDAQPLVYEGETYLMLRDPLMLQEKTLLVPQPLIPILGLCDGSRTAATLRASLALRYGIFLTKERIAEFIEALDDALLLDNEHFRHARTISEVEYRQAEFRKPTSAGAAYPADPEGLASYLNGFLNNSNRDAEKNGASVRPIRGLVSPHIDYERGGAVYAQVWSQAAQAVREADLAIIFGTDHFSEGLPFSLTRQNYATPFGTLPTDTSAVDALANAIGSETAFSGELHHRREHSIELAAVWLHFIRQRPLPLVPILTGDLQTIMQLDDGQALSRVLDVLQETVQGKNALIIAAGDLVHVGPAFQGSPVDPGALIQLKDADDELIQAMCRGDARGFYNSIMRTQDANNVCGVSPIYLTLRLLDPLQGESLGYAVCPADQNNTSVVTICGVIFH